MLYLQASAAGDPAFSERLNEASTRISTVGRAYERLAFGCELFKQKMTAFKYLFVTQVSACLRALIRRRASGSARD
jgi:hypothetical protein